MFNNELAYTLVCLIIEIGFICQYKIYSLRTQINERSKSSARIWAEDSYIKQKLSL